MRKIVKYLLFAAALTIVACSKSNTEGINDLSRQYLSSWLKVHHPDVKPSGHGIYILSETAGTEVIGSPDDYPYVRVDYVSRALNGTITDYTEEKTAKQMGTYYESNVYVPQIFYRGEGCLNIGLVDALDGARIGSTRTVLIPGWLNSTDIYDTEQEYINNVSGTTGIYELTVREQIKDIVKWELDSLVNYVHRNYGLEAEDSLQYGFYLHTIIPGTEEEMPADTTLKVRYIGRLLNGSVFDTNIKDTAIYYGLYVDGTTYSSASVTTAESYEDYQMDQSSVISGFGLTISKMHPGESASGIFYSTLGYGTSGSGSSIPAYSPLRFDIFLVDE